jgi:hypothetical protein
VDLLDPLTEARIRIEEPRGLVSDWENVRSRVHGSTLSTGGPGAAVQRVRFLCFFDVAEAGAVIVPL